MDRHADAARVLADLYAFAAARHAGDRDGEQLLRSGLHRRDLHAAAFGAVAAVAAAREYAHACWSDEPVVPAAVAALVEADTPLRRATLTVWLATRRDPFGALADVVSDAWRQATGNPFDALTVMRHNCAALQGATIGA
jgi:hypothetical protein